MFQHSLQFYTNGAAQFMSMTSPNAHDIYLIFIELDKKKVGRERVFQHSLQFYTNGAAQFIHEHDIVKCACRLFGLPWTGQRFEHGTFRKRQRRIFITRSNNILYTRQTHFSFCKCIKSQRNLDWWKIGD